MADMRAAGSQILLATHSPILASLPGARLIELSDTGLNHVEYDACQLVQSWRSFLDAPERFHKYLL
jgi:predicted ATPase